MQKSIEAKPRKRNFGLAWVMASAVVAALLVIGLAANNRNGARGRAEQSYSEVADLHVATLASSAPVDVVSTDRHTGQALVSRKDPIRF